MAGAEFGAAERARHHARSSTSEAQLFLEAEARTAPKNLQGAVRGRRVAPPKSRKFYTEETQGPKSDFRDFERLEDENHGGSPTSENTPKTCRRCGGALNCLRTMATRRPIRRCAPHRGWSRGIAAYACRTRLAWTAISSVYSTRKTHSVNAVKITSNSSVHFHAK